MFLYWFLSWFLKQVKLYLDSKANADLIKLLIAYYAHSVTYIYGLYTYVYVLCYLYLKKMTSYIH